MDDRPRKDRLIQTRVPQDLESTLKDEARKRRLSVSHLIRNVLEDTFSLVDNVVTEVDRVVTDSVEMAQTLKRDAQRLAATARGHTSHRDGRRHGSEREQAAYGAAIEDAVVQPVEPPPAAAQVPGDAAASELTGSGVHAAAEPEPPVLAAAALADVYGFQELVLNRVATCANCSTTIARGSRAHLGMTDKPELPRVWVCQSCLDLISQ
ncbi:MAG: hypothetical protein JWN48_3884 [Myxococcaceae bacterium]|nr:hypothetical protein [Myxococcaceae bacterium]